MQIIDHIKKNKITWAAGGLLVAILGVGSWSAGGGGDSKVISPGSSSADTTNIAEAAPYDGPIRTFDYKEAIDHIGETAIVTGKVLKVFTAKSGVTFLDFCSNFSDCAFSAVIFASDAKNFKDLNQYEREVKITGEIKSYKGKAEIIVSEPAQIE